jgi:hypothetical protein
MPTSLLAPVRPILHAIARSVVPETASLDDRGWSALEHTMETALAARDGRTRRQLTAFVRLLEVLPVLRHGRRLTQLPVRQRTAFLERIERSPLLLLRRGFWGVRTLIFMGYYTQPAIVSAIGYRAAPGGWAARGGTAASVPLPPPVSVEP